MYGPNTRRAVRNYQRNQGLAVDGIAGPVTLAAPRPRELRLERRRGLDAAPTAPARRRTPRWRRIAQCESSGNPAAVSADGQYRGKYQFSRQTWAEFGGSGDPAAAPEAEQDRIAAALLAARGTQPWPVCGK